MVIQTEPESESDFDIAAAPVCEAEPLKYLHTSPWAPFKWKFNATKAKLGVS